MPLPHCVEQDLVRSSSISLSQSLSIPSQSSGCGNCTLQSLHIPFVHICSEVPHSEVQYLISSSSIIPLQSLSILSQVSTVNPSSGLQYCSIPFIQLLTVCSH